MARQQAATRAAAQQWNPPLSAPDCRISASTALISSGLGSTPVTSSMLSPGTASTGTMPVAGT
jgi:hypothetical protein